MRLFGAFIRVLSDNGTGLHHECRNCGKNLDEGFDECPCCGGPVATYEL